MKEKIVWVVLSPSSMDYTVDGVYDSMEQILDRFKKDWGLDTLTMNDIMDYDWRDDNEIRIERSIHYIDTSEARNEKISEIINK